MGEEKDGRLTMLDSDSRYGPIAQTLAAEVRQAIEPLLIRYGLSHCPREIGMVAHETVNEIVGLMVMIPANKRAEELARWRRNK